MLELIASAVAFKQLIQGKVAGSAALEANLLFLDKTQAWVQQDEGWVDEARKEQQGPQKWSAVDQQRQKRTFLESIDSIKSPEICENRSFDWIVSLII